MPSGLSPIFSDFNCTCLPVTVRKADVFKLLMSYVLTNTLCICFIESCVEECISIGISVDTNSIRSAIWCVLFKENTAVSSWSNPLYFFQWSWNIFQRYNADGRLFLTQLHRTRSTKHEWFIILGSRVRTCNESGADGRRRHDLAQVVIVNVVVGGEFWKFCAIQR